jgi:hypothetical protein
LPDEISSFRTGNSGKEETSTESCSLLDNNCQVTLVATPSICYESLLRGSVWKTPHASTMDSDGSWP